MASVFGFGNVLTLYNDVYVVDGYINTDASGNVVNAQPPTVNDAFGKPLNFPRGISSVSHSGSGLYVVTLEKAWTSGYVHVQPVCYVTTAGTLKVKWFNVTGNTVGVRTAKTIQLQFEQSGSGAALVGGFNILLFLRNS